MTVERIREVGEEVRHGGAGFGGLGIEDPFFEVVRAEAGGDRGEADDGAPGLSTDEMKSRGLLTRRESEILTLLDRGLNNQEIADRLFISIFTVKAHLQNIYGKLDARGRARALAAARSLRLISDA